MYDSRKSHIKKNVIGKPKKVGKVGLTRPLPPKFKPFKRGATISPVKMYPGKQVSKAGDPHGPGVTHKRKKKIKTVVGKDYGVKPTLYR
jgi:hypothetical protein